MAAASSAFSPVPTETIGRAVEALLKWISSKAKSQKAQFLDYDELIYLILTLKKIPTNPRTNPYKIPIPHPLYPLDSSPPFEICLIIDDRSKSTLTSDFANKKIQSEFIPISKVLKLSELRTDYRPFEAKRQLCSSYDLFFTDKRVVPVLPRLLGKQFFKKKKIPIPINLQHKNWKEQIENACGSSLLYMRTGTCCVLKVGKASMGREEIVENVVAALAGAVEIVPKKWGNVRSLHLKSLESVALPIYQTVPESGLKIEVFQKEEEVVRKPKLEVDKEKESEKKTKKVSKKGRIHEVRYMDSKIDELMENVADGDGDSKRDNAETLGEEKKMSKRKKVAVAKELNGGDDGLTANVVSGDDDDMDDGEANDDHSEKMGKKKKNKKKKTTAMQEVGDAELNGGRAEIMDKKKKKVIAMEEMGASELNGGDAEITDKKKKKNKKKEISTEEMDANELNVGDAETMDEKKKNKKEKAMTMDGGTLKKLMKVKKGQNMEAVQSKKIMKGSKLEEKEKEAMKKATKRRREIE